MRLGTVYSGFRAAVAVAIIRLRYLLGIFISVEGPVIDTVRVSDSVTLLRVGFSDFVDQIDILSTGLVRMQDYCAYDYILQDYVGVSRDIT